MREFTATELERMQDTQEAAMQDTGVMLRYSEARDDYNNPYPDYTADENSVVCGLEYTDPDEVQESGEVPMIDAWLRLPLATAWDTRDRFRVTHRYGVELADPPEFELVGPVQRGPSGLVVGLRSVM
jgi:hypothetical protein